MPRRVQGPAGIVHEFPDDVTDAEIASVLEGESPAPDSFATRVAHGAGNAVVEGVKGAWNALPIPQALGGSGVIEGPLNAVKGMIGAQTDQYAKAKQAEAEGRTSEMVGHSVAAAIPVVGPIAAHLGEMIGEGQAPEALGEAGVMLLAPELTRRISGAARSAMAARAAKAAPRAAAAAEADFLMGVPSTKSAPYTAAELRTARPYLNEQHAGAPITTTKAALEAADNGIGAIENHVAQAIENYPEASLVPDVKKALTKAFSDHPRSDALAAGAKELESLDLGRPRNLAELDRVRQQLNAENAAVMKRDGYDRATARKVDPAFAAREAAAEAIRDTQYGYLESRGVEGIRELRRDEGALIRVRNAIKRQSESGAREVAGSHNPGMARVLAAAAAKKGATAIGASVGGVPGAMVGAETGEMLGKVIAGGRRTRDDLVARAFKTGTEARPTYPAIPARPTVAGALPPAVRPLGASPDTSSVTSVPAEYAIPERKALPPGREPIVTPLAEDTSGRIPATLPENYVREQQFLDEAVGPKPTSKVAAPDERNFLLRWMADDLREARYEGSSRMRGTHGVDEATDRAYGEKATNYSGRVAGTPTQEMFHALGIKGTRAEIANQIDNYMRGGGRGGKKLEPLADALREAWDGQRFDFDLISDETIAKLGIRRRDMRSPVTTPHADDMPDVHEKFFGKPSDDDFSFGDNEPKIIGPMSGAEKTARGMKDKKR